MELSGLKSFLIFQAMLSSNPSLGEAATGRCLEHYDIVRPDFIDSEVVELFGIRKCECVWCVLCVGWW